MLYKTIQQNIKAIRHYTPLYNVIQTMQQYIRLYDTIQHYTTLYKTIKIMTLYKIIHNPRNSLRHSAIAEPS
jgi:hypothetical protein